MLEAGENNDNVFATLTYDDDHLPSDRSVHPKHLKQFIRRLVKHVGRPVRYYGVGEYGGQTDRPHYHLALFDFASCQRGQTNLSRDYCCPRCEMVSNVWKNGSIQLGELNDHSSAYIGGYIVKKVLDDGSAESPYRHPEFARMSNRPGIGEGFAHQLASVVLEHDLPFVPRAILRGKTPWPLGRYIREKASEYSGKEVAPAEVAMEVTKLFEEVREDSSIAPFQREWAVRTKLVEQAWFRGKRAEAQELKKVKYREAQQI